LHSAVTCLTSTRQFIKVLPFYIPGFDPRKNQFFAFGESYGGPYVLALAVRILSDESLRSSVNLQGVGLGNPLLSPELQMTYSEMAEGVGYVSRKELAEMRQLEEALRNHIKHNRSSDALADMVKILDTTWVGLKQIYDVSYEGEYLRTNEYFCYLQDPAVMAAIHVGRHQCKRGYRSYQRLENQILTDKRPLLETVLNTSDVKVLLYTGNMDMMIHALGMNRVVDSLSWPRVQEFQETGSKQLFLKVGAETVLSGYFGQGGGLTHLVVRGAGHMVPISRPGVALAMLDKWINKPDWSC